MPITTTESEVPQPIPDWVYWDEDETREQLVDAPLCECCSENRIVRHVSVPDVNLTESVRQVVEPLSNFSWVRINDVGRTRPHFREGDILLRQDWLDGEDYCSNGHFSRHFTALDESYDYMCDGCYDHRCEAESDAQDDERYSEYVHSYSYRLRLQFFDYVQGQGVVRIHSLNTAEGNTGKYSPASPSSSVPIQIPVCGIELEMSDEAEDLEYGDAARYLHRAVQDFACLKEDGSVGNGFELVTQPHTLRAYQERTEMWSALDYLRNNGWRSWSSSSSCGLHIHINNASFVDVGHAMRFLKFIYMNKNPLVAFAGRDSSYARFNFDEFVQREVQSGWNDDGSMKFETQNLSHLVKKSQTNQGRYLAVNAQNAHTYELRFFRGSMRPATVLACLEFTFALHEYTQGLNSHDCLVKRALSWRAFLAFIRNKSGEENFAYRNLLTRLTQSRRNPDTGFLGLSDES
jgi:hypothetical protein